MKFVLAMMFCFASTGSTVRPDAEHQALIAQIESAVPLPKGAEPISHYTRKYAMRPDGMVVAFYFIPDEADWSAIEGYDCEVALENFGSRACTEKEVAEVKQDELSRVARNGAAGESQWLDDYRDLPYRTVLYCSQIEIVFDPRSQKIEVGRCYSNLD